MTRGYVCTVNGAKIKKVAYLQSDAYLSGYGLEILKAIADNSIDSWMEKQISYNHECYGKDEPSPHFSLSWIRRGKENRDWEKYDFAEYGYLYNEQDGSLKVYCFGKLSITVRKEQREKYLYYFQHAFQIDGWLRYDADKLAEINKPIKKLIDEATLQTLRKWVKESEAPRLELEDYHCISAGHSHEYPSYKKILRMSNRYDRMVEFIVSKCSWSKKWEVMIQLPYSRAVIQRGFSSEKKAVEFIRTLAKEHQDKLMRMSEIVSSICEAYRNNHYDELKLFINNLDNMWEQESWFTPGGLFTPQHIQNHYNALL